MSTSIRPPGGPASGTSGIDGTSEINRTEPGGTSEGVTGTAAASQAPVGVESPTAVWLRRLEAGEVTRHEAVEGLVADAVAAHGAHLSVAQQSELSDVLRATLLDDPVLGRLLRGA